MDITFLIAFSFTGLIFIAISIYLKNKTDYLIRKCKSKTKGILKEVGEVVREHSDDDHYYKRIHYFPIYEFEVQGKKYQTRGTKEAFSKYYFKIGEIVDINYNQENPEESYKEGDEFSKVWLIFLIVGIICIIQGIAFSLLSKI